MICPPTKTYCDNNLNMENFLISCHRGNSVKADTFHTNGVFTDVTQI